MNARPRIAVVDYGAGIRMDEIEVRPVGDAREQWVLARALDLVPADVGKRRCGVEADRAPGERAERLGPVLVADVEEELQAQADAKE